jgi:transcription antitermination factor NusG
MVPVHLGKPWFAVQVAPRFEARVASLLEYKGYQSFFPTYKALRRWSDRTKTLYFPLFPGYVFCRSDGPTLGLVVSTPHVVRIVSLRGNPSPIDDKDIDALRRVERSGTTLRPCSYLRIGERVQIKSGPLSGLVGILVQIRNESRLVISIDAIMKSVSVDATAC